MVRHIVMWNYKEGFTKEENAKNGETLKAELENLIHLIDEIKELKVELNPLSSSNRDVILNSLFESEEALITYQKHPEHVRVGGLVATIMQDRACMDYYE